MCDVLARILLEKVEKYYMKNQTEKLILEAAIQLFAENGYTDTGTKMIAKKAGLHESTLFRHFKGKKAIFHRAIMENSPIKDFSQINKSLGRGLEEDLTHLADHYLRIAFENIHLFRIGLMEAPKNEEFAKILTEIVNTLEGHLISYLNWQYEQGSIQYNDFTILAKLFYSILYQQVFTSIIYGNVEDFHHFSNDAIVERCVLLFVTHLKPNVG